MGIGDERAKDRTAFQHFKDEAQLLLAVKLFETGKLSIGQAATSCYSKRTFIELLSKMGIPVINYPDEDLEGD